MRHELECYPNSCLITHASCLTLSTRAMHFENGSLHIGSISTIDLANRFGTPLYVYDAAVIRRQVENLRRAFGALPFRPFYAMKANSALAILRLVHQAGFGADAVSPGEIFLARRATRHRPRSLLGGPGAEWPAPNWLSW